MAITKVSGDLLDPGIVVAGVVTATKFSGPFDGTSGDFSGNVSIGGSLTVNGDFTTLNTTLRNIEMLRVDANSATAAGIITQTGAGDILKLYDDSTQAVTVQDGGRVLIGTITEGHSNADDLTIATAAGSLGNTGITIRSSTTGDGNIFFSDATSGDGETKGVIKYTHAGDYFRFNTDGGERLRIDSSGHITPGSDNSQNIGSGTTNFASVWASTRFRGNDNVKLVLGNSQNLVIRHDGSNNIIGSPVADDLHIKSGTGDNDNQLIAAFKHSNSFVGIGTTNPTKLLELFGTDPTIKLMDSSGDAYALIEGDSADQGSIRFRADPLAAGGSTHIRFDVDGTESLRINNDGNVGIGTDTMDSSGNLNITDTGSARIYMKSGDSADCSIYFGSFNDTATGGIRYDHSDDSLRLYGYNNSEALRIDTDGQVGIGTEPASGTTLDIDASGGGVIVCRRNSVSTNNKISLSHDGTNGTLDSTNDIIFRAAGSERVRFDSDGKATFTGDIATAQDYPNIRPVLDFNFAATKKLKPNMTFARQGEASFHDGVGSVKFVSDNEPRFEHDIVTGECKGLMFEAAGTNYSHYSRRFDVTATGSWVKVGSSSITADTYTAPDGTSSGLHMADTLTGADGTTFNGNVLRQQLAAGAGVKHTFSIYIKLITSTQATIYIRDGQTGSTSTANAISNTRNWQRVVVTSSATLTNGQTHSFYIGNTNGTIAVWGSQIERNDYVTSYIRQTGATNATRTADDGGVRLDGEDVTDIFNQGEGTLIAEAIPTNSITNQGLVGFYQDFGSVNRVELRSMGTNTANARFESVVGSSSVVTNANSPHAGVNNVSKYAFAFQENNYASTVNGGTVQTDNSGAFPHGTGINSMIIGDSVYSQDAAVIIKRIMYYADRLPNSQLVTLTS